MSTYTVIYGGGPLPWQRDPDPAWMQRDLSESVYQKGYAWGSLLSPEQMAHAKCEPSTPWKVSKPTAVIGPRRPCGCGRSISVSETKKGMRRCAQCRATARNVRPQRRAS